MIDPIPPACSRFLGAGLVCVLLAGCGGDVKVKVKLTKGGKAYIPPPSAMVAISLMPEQTKEGEKSSYPADPRPENKDEAIYNIQGKVPKGQYYITVEVREYPTAPKEGKPALPSEDIGRDHLKRNRQDPPFKVSRMIEKGGVIEIDLDKPD